jgi:hypothetical protein
MKNKLFYLFIVFFLCYSINVLAVNITANDSYIITQIKCYGSILVNVVSTGERNLDSSIYRIDNCTLINSTENNWQCDCNNGQEQNLSISMLVNQDKRFDILIDYFLTSAKDEMLKNKKEFNNIQFIKSDKWNNKWNLPSYDNNFNIAIAIIVAIVFIVVIIVVIYRVWLKYRQYIKETEDDNKFDEDIK